jgi:4-coumarate--CoA ligase
VSRTKEVFINGWVRIGDEVLFEQNGELCVIARIKVCGVCHFNSSQRLIFTMQEIMKVKGFQVAPSEIEGHLLGHPDVVDVAAVGTPDEYAGEVPLAFVVLHEAARKKAGDSLEQAQALKAILIKVKSTMAIKEPALKFLSQYVADHKSPDKRLGGGVYFVDIIPRNLSGKILRRLLNERAKEVKLVTRVGVKL